MVVAAFASPEQALTVAVDDTLFHRYGRTVFGVAWQHDGSAKGRDGIGRGNCFVIAGLVVVVPFTDRKVLLPVLFRLPRAAIKLGSDPPSLTQGLKLYPARPEGMIENYTDTVARFDEIFNKGK